MDSDVVTTSYRTEDKLLNALKFQEMPKESSGEESDIDYDVE